MLGDAAAALDAVAICCALFFMTSPLTQALNVIAAPTKVQLVNPLNLLAFILNCATQLAYGIFMPVAPVIPCNAYGVAVGLFSISTCWWFAHKDEKAERWNKWAFAGTLFVLVLSVLIMAFAGLAGDGAPASVGNLGMVVGIIMYAAPLSVLQEVLRTKSSKTLPVAQILLGFLNSLCWFAVGITRQKAPVWAPNVLGMLLSLFQLGLIFKYPAKDVDASVQDGRLSLKEETPGMRQRRTCAVRATGARPQEARRRRRNEGICTARSPVRGTRSLPFVIIGAAWLQAQIILNVLHKGKLSTASLDQPEVHLYPRQSRVLCCQKGASRRSFAGRMTEGSRNGRLFRLRSMLGFVF